VGGRVQGVGNPTRPFDTLPRSAAVGASCSVGEEKGVNEDKVRAVLSDCYEIAHGQLCQPWVGSLPLEIALERIKEKIETLTDEDLGEEAAGS
jgi:hypothetical protein